MKPYIVINGKDSRSIEGLVITSLPPITKPMKRTSIEEIDGMDGDVVTELGYSAYDKELSIGLSFDYDVDDVISFFDSSGIITFSNEPEKYYKFAIYNQIDFEKLVRFKTATVTIHVQPFKCSTVENEKVFETLEGVVRNSGNIFSRPTLTIEGTGTVEVYVNQQQLFIVDMSNTSKVIIKTEEMNAYYEDGNLANRLIIGDYDNMRLPVGANTISLVGSVDRLTVTNYSRWI